MSDSHQMVVDCEHLMEMELLLSTGDRLTSSTAIKEWLDKVLEDVERGKEGWEPEWEKLPTWIVAVAKDENDTWYLYRNVPYIVEPSFDTWYAIGLFETHVFPDAPLNLPWRQSLRLRREE